MLLLPCGAFAQQNLEAGLFGGFANYQGDLVAPQIEFSETKFSYGAFLRYHVNNKIKVKANAYLGFISGDDANDNSSGGLKARGWSFESNLLEVTAVAEYHPLGRARFSNTGIFRKQLSPYIFAGAGMVNADPTVKVTRPEDEGLFPEQDFSSTFISIPLGGGIRIDLIENLSLGFEGGWRLTLNDYLDGVKTNGNPNGNDLYIFVGTTVSYFFPAQQASTF